MKEKIENKLNQKPEIKEIFERIFEIKEYEIKLEDPRAKELFPNFLNQKITIVRNKVLNAETIFNASRAKRHLPKKSFSLKDDYDPFCRSDLTVNDELGSLENESAKIVSNISKMAPFHSVLYFKKHELDDLNEKDFLSAFELAHLWFQKIEERFKTKTSILIWNYNYRSGASIYHTHFQLLSFYHTPMKFEFLKNRLEEYQKNFKGDYFEDLFKVLNFLGLAKEEKGLKIFLNLTPIKEKEIDFLGEFKGENVLSFWNYLKKLRSFGFENFNFLYLVNSEKIKNIAFLVDRGESHKIVSDFGSLEVFMNSVVSYDPFELAEKIFSNSK
jgi:diadenosine tetraphosphate (Ap4A) HIT family hydrolase